MAKPHRFFPRAPVIRRHVDINLRECPNCTCTTKVIPFDADWFYQSCDLWCRIPFWDRGPR